MIVSCFDNNKSQKGLVYHIALPGKNLLLKYSGIQISPANIEPWTKWRHEIEAYVILYILTSASNKIEAYVITHFDLSESLVFFGFIGKYREWFVTHKKLQRVWEPFPFPYFLPSCPEMMLISTEFIEVVIVN